MLELDVTLAKKRFSLVDQENFSLFSGDFNPIHIDPIAARRSLTGQCIVHGMHCLIWALESLFIKNQLTVAEVKVRFLKPIFLNEEIFCNWNAQKSRISILTECVTLCTIDVTVGNIIPLNIQPKGTQAQSQYPEEISFNECLNFKNYPLNSIEDHILGNKLFPNFCIASGQTILCDLGAASFVVGMKCPGLHSLFLSFNATFNAYRNDSSFTYLESDERFRQVRLSFHGKSTDAEIEAFYRPPPSLSESISLISQQVDKKEFQDVKALIIGGSRGLGATAAKIIAAAGGQVVITYHVGRADAEAICNEITNWGGQCRIIQFDVNQNQKNRIDYTHFNQIYYFATPKVSLKRNLAFDQIQDLACRSIYVNAFKDICMNLIKKDSHTKVLYPSTVLIENTPKGLEHFAHIKLDGEKLCEQLNLLEKIKILVRRLPQLPTDQNHSIFETPRANVVQCLLPIIREMAK
jgi:hypothetical protein